MLKPFSITPQRVYGLLYPQDDLRQDLDVFTTHLLGAENNFMNSFSTTYSRFIRLGGSLDDYSLVVTEKGDLALTWHWDRMVIQAGDVIVDLFGCSIPSILRPLEEASVYAMLDVAQFEPHWKKPTHRNRPNGYPHWIKFETNHRDEYALIRRISVSEE
ncbi:hypothetical protein G6011_08111 [Alternaria panax]|uniref:Uncharacterized protein n=1 Tax=Alternaria panax TaxID=48097 RepID=A0AAD4FJC7_9PLEO|nr:hypothetical protein G6011_08111 [Alternaria panax]